MKTLIFIFSIFAFAFSVSAQNDCPTISVIAPNNITPIGESMIFTAYLSGGSYDKISYEWTISSGTITSGQNTSSITVATNADLAGQTITVVVKISELPKECKNEVSGAGEIASLPPPPVGTHKRPVEYGKISWNEERWILEVVAIELKNGNDSIAYFIVRNNFKNRLQNLKIREAKVKKYFLNKFKIAKNRIKFIDEGDGDYQTTIFIVPAEAVPPQ